MTIQFHITDRFVAGVHRSAGEAALAQGPRIAAEEEKANRFIQTLFERTAFKELRLKNWIERTELKGLPEGTSVKNSKVKQAGEPPGGGLLQLYEIVYRKSGKTDSVSSWKRSDLNP